MRRHSAKGAFLLLAVATILVIDSVPRNVAADENANYKLFCARCHGETGRGDGADAATLKAHPRDFTDCTAMTKIADDTMFKAIKEGGDAVGLSADMPAWSSGLEDEDIKGLMKYIRSFCRK